MNSRLTLYIFLLLINSSILSETLLNTAYLNINAKDVECIQISAKARAKFEKSNNHDVVLDEMFMFDKDNLLVIVECIESKKLVFVSIASDGKVNPDKIMQHFIEGFRKVKVNASANNK